MKMKRFSTLIILSLVLLFSTASFAQIPADQWYSNISMEDSLGFMPVAGMFQAQFKLSIDSLGPNGIVWRVGFSKDSANGWGDTSPILAFNKDGAIKARNGGSYTADSAMTFVQGDSFMVTMNINVVADRYDIMLVKNDGGSVALATDYEFRNSADTLAFMYQYIDYGTQWGGDPGIITVSDIQLDDFIDMPISANNGTFQATFDMSIDSLGAQGVVWRIGFSDSAASSWGDVGPILALNKDYSIKARNGNSYTNDSAMTYAVGDSFKVEMNINSNANTYTIILQKNGGGRVAIATDYAFRNAAEVVDNLYYFMDAESNWRGDPGIITVTNLAIDQFTDTPLGENYRYDVAAGMFEAKYHISVDSLGTTKGCVWRMGFSEGGVGGWGDVGPIIGMNNNYQFVARNGSSYSAENTITYALGDTFHVIMHVNVVANTCTYLVKKMGDAEYTVLGKNYAFRNASPTIDNMYTFMGNTRPQGWAGEAGQVNIFNLEMDDFLDTPIEPKTTPFTTNFTIAIDSLGAQGVVWRFGYSDSAASGWGDVGPILALNKDYSIKARNANSYTTENAVTYAQGDTIDVSMSVNPMDTSYSITVDINGAGPVVIADNYQFRNPATTIDNQYEFMDAESNWKGDPGIITFVNDITVPVADAAESIAFTYDLAHNYPNPFNPTTKIAYSVQEAGVVTIKVYNILGREVATLVNKEMAPGRYDIQWDAMNKLGQKVAAGVYMYKMQVNDFTKVQKMMLIK